MNSLTELNGCVNKIEWYEKRNRYRVSIDFELTNHFSNGSDIKIDKHIFRNCEIIKELHFTEISSVTFYCDNYENRKTKISKIRDLNKDI